MDLQAINEASKYIQAQIAEPPTIGLVLGSGLGLLADEIEEKKIIPYEQIPHFAKTTVSGHSGKLVIGKLSGKQVIAMKGRFHFYEGYSLKQVTFPIRVMKQLGIHSLLITNAAGGINEQFKPGDLMVITDHINLLGSNPLIGPHHELFGDRFPDMTKVYDPDYIQLVKTCAKELNIPIHEGVYVANSGPSYETPAEIKMLRYLGGDAVGMSTVPEAIVAKQEQIKILGISCISNMAAGILDQPLSHEEVIATTEKVKAQFLRLIREVISKLSA